MLYWIFSLWIKALISPLNWLEQWFYLSFKDVCDYHPHWISFLLFLQWGERMLSAVSLEILSHKNLVVLHELFSLKNFPVQFLTLIILFHRLNPRGFNFALAWANALFVTALILKSSSEISLTKRSSSLWIEVLNFIIMNIHRLKVKTLSLENTPWVPSLERLLNEVSSISLSINLVRLSR